tara:strand:- start:509 stop:733 length:225 start_codon:yes stop_codon:yes gene_type:complete
MKQLKGANMFRKIATGFGALAFIAGIMMAAGSAGDCDGKCMEQANDFATMLILSGTGVVFMLAGAFFMMVGNSE